MQMPCSTDLHALGYHPIPGTRLNGTCPATCAACDPATGRAAADAALGASVAAVAPPFSPGMGCEEWRDAIDRALPGAELLLPHEHACEVQVQIPIGNGKCGVVYDMLHVALAEPPRGVCNLRIDFDPRRNEEPTTHTI